MLHGRQDGKVGHPLDFHQVHGPVDGVVLHDGPFFRCQAPRFHEDLFRRGDLADIVQRGGNPDVLQVRGLESHVLRQVHGQNAHVCRVGEGILVAGLEF